LSDAEKDDARLTKAKLLADTELEKRRAACVEIEQEIAENEALLKDVESAGSRER
jgi:hypothetical protein